MFWTYYFEVPVFYLQNMFFWKSAYVPRAGNILVLKYAKARPMIG